MEMRKFVHTMTPFVILCGIISMDMVVALSILVCWAMFVYLIYKR